MNIHISSVAARIIVGCALLISLVNCCANGEAVWGESTNGIRLGMRISTQSGIFGTPPLCGVDIQNITSNAVRLRLPEIERRYKMELRGPDGGKISLKTLARISDMPGLRRSAYNPGSSDEIDCFSIPDAFMLRTNGPHQLVVSVWVSTNFPGRGDTNYFLLPPVTNTIDIQLFKPPVGKQ